jgi:hypothetical protein
LLLVQKSSVIVIERRRGHPEVVPLGGSLKSLAFVRECPKARSD